MTQGTLLVMNLKTDADDDVLGFTTDWINALAPRYRAVEVITMCAGRLAVAPNVRVHSVGKEKGYSEARRVLEFYRILSGVLAGGEVRACFAHMMPLFAVMAWPLLRLRGVPTVLWYAHKSVTPVLRIADRLVDRVVTSTRTGFRLPSRKMRIVGQGIDVDRFRPMGPCPGPFRVLSLGRISRIKRIEVLIEAVGILSSRGALGDLCAAVVGAPLTADDHVYLKELEDAVHRLGLGERVSFEGAAPFHRIHVLYQGAGCFVNSSETGSLDKTILEAMSCGVPVITSNAGIGSAAEGRDVLDGWIAPPGDSIGLADRLQRLMAMPADARQELGFRLREEVVKNHSLKQLAQRIHRELALLAESRGHRTHIDTAGAGKQPAGAVSADGR